MNYIVLEGIGFYLFLSLLLLVLFVALVSVICVVLMDKRNFVVEKLLLAEKEKLKFLEKENFALRIKSGELEIDEK